MKRTKRPRIWSATATGPSVQHTLSASARWGSAIIRLLRLWFASRQRFISIMTAASLFWPASICLGVIVAQAQELPRNDLKTEAAPTIEQQPSQKHSSPASFASHGESYRSQRSYSAWQLLASVDRSAPHGGAQSDRRDRLSRD